MSLAAEAPFEVNSIFGLLGSWFGQEVALNRLFPYHFPIHSLPPLCVKPTRRHTSVPVPILTHNARCGNGSDSNSDDSNSDGWPCYTEAECICENHGFNMTQCESMACCQWGEDAVGGQCWADNERCGSDGNDSNR